MATTAFFTGERVDFRVKGTHIAECRDFFDERLGTGTYEKAWREAGGQWHSVVLPGAWYEISVADAVLRALCVRTGEDFVSAQSAIGARNAEHDLTTIYRVFLRMAQPKRVIAAIPLLWRNYVSSATARVTSNETGHAVFECADIPESLGDWALGSWMGFIPCAVKLAGAKDVRMKLLHRQLSARSNVRLEFSIEYTLR